MTAIAHALPAAEITAFFADIKSGESFEVSYRYQGRKLRRRTFNRIENCAKFNEYRFADVPGHTRAGVGIFNFGGSWNYAKNLLMMEAGAKVVGLRKL